MTTLRHSGATFWENVRIVRLSRVREFVLGFQDGLLVPLAVVTGLAGATVTASTVIVGGLAEAAAARSRDGNRRVPVGAS